MHHPHPFVFLFSFSFSFCGLLTAQAATVAVRAASALSTSAHNGPFTVAQTLPIGPLPTIGSVDSVATNGTSLVEASTAWGATTNSTLAGFVVEQHLTVRGSASGNCVSGPHQIVFAVACPVTRAAILIVRLSKAASPGLPSTTVMVDVGNDGTFDLTAASPVSLLHSAVSIGPQPLEVRVVLSGAIPLGQPADASLDDLVTVVVEPDNHLSVVPAAAGCANQAATLLPAWDLDSVVLDVDASVAPPLVIGVFGLSPAPVLLPNASAALPCLLLPQPDLVVVFQPGGFTLPLPQAVRPLNVWAQCVLLDLSGLSTTNGFLVNAF
jgi:hypothetical protein